jgi:hypothetical protein
VLVHIRGDGWFGEDVGVARGSFDFPPFDELAGFLSRILGIVCLMRIRSISQVDFGNTSWIVRCQVEVFSKFGLCAEKLILSYEFKSTPLEFVSGPRRFYPPGNFVLY